MSEIKKATVRFRMDQEQDRRAYVFLMNEGKVVHRSISRAVVAAVDGFFSRQEQVRNDPYLETREKENAFLTKIEQTVRDSIQSSALGYLSLMAQNNKNGIGSIDKAGSTENKADEDADLDAALDFVNSL